MAWGQGGEGFFDCFDGFGHFLFFPSRRNGKEAGGEKFPISLFRVPLLLLLYLHPSTAFSFPPKWSRTGDGRQEKVKKNTCKGWNGGRAACPSVRSLFFFACQCQPPHGGTAKFAVSRTEDKMLPMKICTVVESLPPLRSTGEKNAS